MRNQVECSNCQTNNDITNLTCKNCKHFLRDKIVNIDIWKFFWELLENPTNALKKIILAEHKNYIIILTLLIVLKIGLIGNLINNIVQLNSFYNSNFVTNIFKFAISFVLAISIISVITRKIISFKFTRIKLKDSFALLIFSFWSLTFSIVLLTIIEYTLFGSYFFTFEFSPLEIKKYPFYIICFLELIPIIASYIYLYLGFKFLTKNNLFALGYSFIIIVLIGLLLFFVTMF